jgi:hypothetical protein
MRWPRGGALLAEDEKMKDALVRHAEDTLEMRAAARSFKSQPVPNNLSATFQVLRCSSSVGRHTSCGADVPLRADLDGGGRRRR